MVFLCTSEHAIMSWNDEEPYQNWCKVHMVLILQPHFPLFRTSSQLKCKACNHLFAPSVHQGWWLPSKVACYPLQALAWACACYPLVCLCASLLPPWGIVPSPRCRPLLQWLLHCTTLLPPCSSLILWLLVTRWEIALSVTRLVLSKLLPT